MKLKQEWRVSDMDRLGLPDGEQMLLIAKKVAEAKTETRTNTLQVVLAMVDEIRNKYLAHSVRYPAYRDEYEAAATACETIQTKLEAMKSND